MILIPLQHCVKQETSGWHLNINRVWRPSLWGTILAILSEVVIRTFLSRYVPFRRSEHRIPIVDPQMIEEMIKENTLPLISIDWN
jgi:hypothetical protein